MRYRRRSRALGEAVVDVPQVRRGLQVCLRESLEAGVHGEDHVREPRVGRCEDDCREPVPGSRSEGALEDTAWLHHRPPG
jgi:hypothetical protein